jgi:ferritin-like metal-binding protein YciE
MISELKDIYSAETQLVRALPTMAKAAGSETLKAAFKEHLEQTKGHVARLEEAFEILGESPRGKKCKAMEGLIAEGSEMAQEEGQDIVRDAGLIASAQRVEHYEIAAYGSTVAFARQMGHEDIAALLEETLEEEKATDEKLSGLAESEINPAAQATGESDEESMEESDEEAEPVKARKAAPASKSAASSRKSSKRS